MGAFLGGLLSGYGQHVHEQNLLQEQREQQSRKDLADFYDNLAHQAEVEGQVEHASKLRTYGYQVRSTPVGKKLDKSLTDIRSAMLGPVAQPQQAAQPKESIRIPATLLAPPPGQSTPSNLPVPPSSGGGEAGPAAGVPPAPAVLGGMAPVTMMPGAAAPSVGFTIPQASLPPPPGAEAPTPAQQGLVMGPDGQWHRSPTGTPELRAYREEQHFKRRYEAENIAEMQKMQQVEAFKRAEAKRTIDERVQSLKDDHVWEKLTDRQKAAVRSGAANITPERAPISLPGMHDGASAPEGQLDISKQPIVPGKPYVVKLNVEDGSQIWAPVTGRSTTFIEEKEGKWFKVTHDQMGNEISRSETSAPIAARPRVTESNQYRDVGGEVRSLPKTTVVTRPGTTGGSLPARPGSPAPAPRAAGGGAPPVGRSVGPTPAQFRRELENPLTPAGQRTMAESQPVVNMIDRALKIIEPVKGSNDPLHYSLQRAGYAVGLATEASNLINNLELQKVVGAARVLKGSSRAIEALRLAMQHLPDPKKDSPKLIYEKLQNIRQNLSDIQTAAQQYERKYPGMNPPPGGGTSLAPPPSTTVVVISPEGKRGTIPAEKLQEALKRGFKQVQ